MILDLTGQELRKNDTVTVLVPCYVVAMSQKPGTNQELEVIWPTLPQGKVVHSKEVAKTGRGYVSLLAYSDNGFDPILGPPYPPVNYQMTVNRSASRRLEWSAPDVFITIAAGLDESSRRTAIIEATNYSEIPEGTTLHLWVKGGPATDYPNFTEIDSLVAPNAPHFEWVMPLPPPVDEAPPHHEDYVFYVTATAGGTTLYSQNVTLGIDGEIIPP